MTVTHFHRISRTARAAGLAAGAMLGASLVAAPRVAAQTAGSCNGSITGRQTVAVAGTVIGEIVVYYQSGSGGSNTACMYHRGPTYGVSTDSMVQLGECFGSDCTNAFDGGNFMRDSGDYARLAGPVRRLTTNGNCVVAEGRITWRGQFHIWSTGRVGCS